MNLYIVSTPIGNLQDSTLRALETILTTPVVITESTSKFGIISEFAEKTLNRQRIENQKVISYSEDEEEQKLPLLIKILEENDAALVSEAGTPLISDPGFKLIREAIKRDINVISIPGATAPIAALTSSGLPNDKFMFLGFLPKKESKKSEMLTRVQKFREELGFTLIFFESPHRIIESLQAINQTFGDISIVVSRELTKIHEEIKREKISSLVEYFEKHPAKGEFVILL